MSKFYIASASASAASTPAYEASAPSSGDEDDDDEYDLDDLSTLPYPAELPRSDFLTPNFDAQTYLSTLRNRHQTLEDLRADLRQRSQQLSQELLDLVNGNYEEFLSLGGDLRGGEDRVEGVRLGLLGFQREVAGIKAGVRARADEVLALLRERKAIRREAVTGRNLLEVGVRVSELERKLGIAVDGDENGGEDEEEEVFDEEEEEEDEEEEDGSGATPAAGQVRRLQRLTEQFSLVANMVQRIGPEQPFLLALQPRLAKVRKTILLDLAAALRNARDAKDSNAVMVAVGLFGDLHAQAEGVRVLKGS